MKKYILVTLLLIVTTTCFSQDVLLFQDGNKKDAKILEITPEIVKYQKFNSSSEVIYTEDKYNLIGVIFEDGEFEKFESSKSSKSKKSTSSLGDYGNNMFYIEPLAPIIGGYIGIGYEHFSRFGGSSITIPLRIQVVNYSETYNSSELLATGIKHKFFPTGSSGGVKGFLGYAENLGFISLQTTSFYDDWYGDTYYTYNNRSYFFNETQFIGGVQFHPSKLINITLDVGIGLGMLDFDESYLSWDASLNVGFRF
jgi:hypothetical protein